MPLLLLSLMIYSRQTDHARHRSKHLCLEVSFYFFLFYSFRHGVWHHCANPVFGDREAQSLYTVKQIRFPSKHYFTHHLIHNDLSASESIVMLSSVST